MLASTVVMSPTRKRAFMRSSRASCSVRPDRSGTITVIGIASANPTGVPTATGLPGVWSCLSTVPDLMLASTVVMSPTRKRAFMRSSRASCSVRPDRSGTVAGGWPRPPRPWLADESGTTTVIGLASTNPTRVPTATALPGVRSCLNTVPGLILASTAVMSPTRKRAFMRSSRASCSVRPDRSGTVAGGWPRPPRPWLADESGTTTVIGLASTNPTRVPTATALPGVRSCLSTVPGLMLASTVVMSPTRKRAFRRSSRASCSVRPDRSGTVAGGWPRSGRCWLVDRSGTTTVIGLASANPTSVPTATALPGVRSCLNTVPGLILASTVVMSPTRKRAFARSARASCSVRPDRSGTVAGGWPRSGRCWLVDSRWRARGLSPKVGWKAMGPALLCCRV